MRSTDADVTTSGPMTSPLTSSSSSAPQARKYGVRAAMPGFIARKLCPQLVFVKPDFKKYTHYCHLTREGARNFP